MRFVRKYWGFIFLAVFFLNGQTTPVSCNMQGGGSVPTSPPTTAPTPTPAPGQSIGNGMWNKPGTITIDQLASDPQFGHAFDMATEYDSPANVESYPSSQETLNYAATQQANDPSPGAYYPRMSVIATSAGNGGGDCAGAIADLNLGNNNGGTWGQVSGVGTGHIALATAAFMAAWSNATLNPNHIPAIWRVCYEYNHGTPQQPPPVGTMTAAQFRSGMHFLATELRADLTRNGCGPSPNDGITGPATYPTCDPSTVVLLMLNTSADNLTASIIKQYYPGTCLWLSSPTACFPIISEDVYDVGGNGFEGRLSVGYNAVVAAQSGPCSSATTVGVCITSDGTATGSPLPFEVPEFGIDGGGCEPNNGNPGCGPPGPANQPYFLVPYHSDVAGGTCTDNAPYHCFPLSSSPQDMFANFPNMTKRCVQANGVQLKCGGMNYFSSNGALNWKLLPANYPAYRYFISAMQGNYTQPPEPSLIPNPFTTPNAANPVDPYSSGELSTLFTAGGGFSGGGFMELAVPIPSDDQGLAGPGGGVFQAVDSRDPGDTINCSNPACPLQGATIHIPAYAKPQSGFDVGGEGHMAIINPGEGEVYEFYKATATAPPVAGTFQVNYAAACAYNAYPSLTAGCNLQSTAGGLPFSALMLRPDELLAADAASPVTDLGHAIAVSGCARSASIYPGFSPYGITRGCPPMGATIILNKTDAQIKAYAVPKMEKAILLTMAHYGLMITDQNAHPMSFFIQEDNSYTSVGLPPEWPATLYQLCNVEDTALNCASSIANGSYHIYLPVPFAQSDLEIVYNPGLPTPTAPP